MLGLWWFCNEGCFVFNIQFMLNASFKVLFLCVLFFSSICAAEHVSHVHKVTCTYSLKNFDFHYEKEATSTNVVMLGDSLIRGGDWSQLIGRNDIVNRGISGDTLPCIVARLNYLKNLNAKIYFIEGGVNSVSLMSAESMLLEYKRIVTFVIEQGAIPVVHTVLYISPLAGKLYPSRRDYKKINEMISDFNTLLIAYARKNNIDYIDINEVLSHKKQLKNDFTTDGVHLNSKGYAEWKDLIKNILDENNI